MFLMAQQTFNIIPCQACFGYVFMRFFIHLHDKFSYFLIFYLEDFFRNLVLGLLFT